MGSAGKAISEWGTGKSLANWRDALKDVGAAGGNLLGSLKATVQGAYQPRLVDQGKGVGQVVDNLPLRHHELGWEGLLARRGGGVPLRDIRTRRPTKASENSLHAKTSIKTQAVAQKDVEKAAARVA